MNTPTDNRPSPERRPVLGCLLAGFVLSGIVVYPVVLFAGGWPDAVWVALGVQVGLLLLHRFALWTQSDNLICGTLPLVMLLCLFLLSFAIFYKVTEAEGRRRERQPQPPALNR